MKNYIQSLVIIVFAAVIVFMASHMTNLYEGSDLPFQIVTAFISVVMMGIVTWILLKGQSGADEGKDKNVKVFKEKLKVYAQFNQELWRVKDKDALTNLLDKCMQELVLVLPYDRMDAMRKFLRKLAKEIETEASNEFKGGITAILKADISGHKQDDIEERKNDICRLANVFGEEQRMAEKIESKADDAKKNNPVLSVNEEKPQYWHFAAWDNEKQNKALQNKNSDYHVLSLMEYDEDWRTARLRQVENGDVLFLFNRGGAGYVGMYKAIGNCIIHNLGESGVRVEEHRQGDEPKKMKYKELPDSMRKYDIYEAFDDGATYVSSVIVEKIKELDGDTCNPINVVRQTIARLSKDNAEALLRYFDEKETDKNN